MIEGIVGIISLFIVLPGIIFTFVYNNNKKKLEITKLKYQKEILELEIQKENIQLKLFEAENKKLDKIINNETEKSEKEY
jgi:hypothetical protein